VASFNSLVDLELLAEVQIERATGEDKDFLCALVDSLRVQIPALGLALSACIDSGNGREHFAYGQQLAAWIQKRTLTVYHDLERHRTEDGQPNPEEIVQPDWKTVCSFHDTIIRS